MIKQGLYNRTVDILVKAYFDDTLSHGFCTSCAVGNLVAANMGYSFSEKSEDAVLIGDCPHFQHSYNWITPIGVIGCMQPNWWFSVRRATEKEINDTEAIEQINATGYTALELMKIENAFENAAPGQSSDEWMFNGLMAVIEILDQIHHNTDEQVTKISKQRFVKTPCTK